MTTGGLASLCPICLDRLYCVPLVTRVPDCFRPSGQPFCFQGALLLVAQSRFAFVSLNLANILYHGCTILSMPITWVYQLLYADIWVYTLLSLISSLFRVFPRFFNFRQGAFPTIPYQIQRILQRIYSRHNGLQRMRIYTTTLVYRNMPVR